MIDRVAGMGQRRGRRLHEDVGERLGRSAAIAAPLGDVLRVVAGQQEELPGGRSARAARTSSTGMASSSTATTSSSSTQGQVADGVEGRPVGGEQLEQVVGRRQEQFDPDLLAVRLGRLVDRDDAVVGVEARQDQSSRMNRQSRMPDPPRHDEPLGSDSWRTKLSLEFCHISGREVYKAPRSPFWRSKHPAQLGGTRRVIMSRCSCHY